jgi:hypothetical protein
MNSETPQPAATAWMPIETAPKDGTRILAYQPDGQWRGNNPDRRERQEVVYWHQPGNPAADGFWMPYLRPTHWMPLPAPPTAEGRTE